VSLPGKMTQRYKARNRMIAFGCICDGISAWLSRSQSRMVIWPPLALEFGRRVCQQVPDEPCLKANGIPMIVFGLQRALSESEQTCDASSLHSFDADSINTFKLTGAIFRDNCLATRRPYPTDHQSRRHWGLACPFESLLTLLWFWCHQVLPGFAAIVSRPENWPRRGERNSMGE